MSVRKPRQAFALLALIGVVATVLLASPIAQNAGAQPTVAPHVSLDVQMNDDDSQARVVVSLDPGSEEIVALEGALSYNPDLATPIACGEYDGFGACNPASPGFVLFATASTGGVWSEPTELMVFELSVLDASAIGISVGKMFSPLHELTEPTVGDPIAVGKAAAAVGDGAITGTILAGDAPLFGTQVCATNDEASVCTDVDSRGAYRIEGLATGSYTVTAQHYDEAFGSLTLPDVEVVSPDLTQGIDGALTALVPADAADDEVTVAADESVATVRLGTAPAEDPSVIAGTVVDAAGQPIPAAWVCVEDPAIGNETCGGTRFDGGYYIKNLPGGNYIVTVSDPGGRYEDHSSEQFGLNAVDYRRVDFTLVGG